MGRPAKPAAVTTTANRDPNEVRERRLIPFSQRIHSSGEEFRWQRWTASTQSAKRRGVLLRWITRAKTGRRQRAMNLQIIALRTELDDGFREYVEQRLHFGLLPCEHRIAKATVLFSDLNGSRGRVDQHCSITLSLTAGGEIRAEGRGVTARLGLGRAAERVCRKLRYVIESKRDSRRRDARKSRHRPAA